MDSVDDVVSVDEDDSVDEDVSVDEVSEELVLLLELESTDDSVELDELLTSSDSLVCECAPFVMPTVVAQAVPPDNTTPTMALAKTARRFRITPHSLRRVTFVTPIIVSLPDEF